MNKLILLILMMAPLIGFAQVDANQLEGEWILSDIQSKDSIWIAVNPNAQIPAQSNGKKVSAEYEQKKISIVEYMQKDLACGITRFVFKGNQFEFYRNEKLTFKGTYKTKGTQLVLEYENNEGKGTKRNTLVTLTEEKLVLGSESKEKPVLLSFFKK